MRRIWQILRNKIGKKTQTVLFLLVHALCYYGALRLTGIGSPGQVAAGVLIGAWGSLCIWFQMRSRIRTGSGYLYRGFVWLSGMFQALFLYYLGALLLLDLLHLPIVHLFGLKRGLHPWALGAAAASCAVTVYGLIHARVLKTVRYQVHPESPLAAPVRIVQLSDIHLGAVIGGHMIRRIVRETNALEPDLVVVTGDLFNHKRVRECPEVQEAAALLSEIRAPLGVYSVCGNHDPDPDDPEFRAFLRAAHMQEADNRIFDLGPVLLAGRTGIAAHAFTEGGGDDRVPLTELFAQADSGRKPTVVLDHDPAGIPEARDAGADLVLCGHTHNGQFFPVTLFARLAFPKGCFYGRSESGRTTSIVSAGTGYFQMPVRVGTNSEIVVIDLS